MSEWFGTKYPESHFIFIIFNYIYYVIMIFAFGVVLLQLKSENPNSSIILIGIMTSIVGFGMLLIGNYLIYAIMEVTGC